MLLVNNLFTRLMQPNVITGLILLVIGFLLAIFALKITRKIRKQQNINSSDKIFLLIKALALAIILTSLIVMIIE